MGEDREQAETIAFPAARSARPAHALAHQASAVASRAVPLVAHAILEIAQAVLTDLRQRGDAARQLSLNSTLDHDLGLDSLARVELFTRIERDLNVRLPDALFGSAETLGDIAAAVDRGSSVRPIPPLQADRHIASNSVPTRPPTSAATLDQVLRWHRDQHPAFAQITLCNEPRDETITYEQLWNDAQSIAGGLQRMGIRRGDSIALMLPTSRDYFGAFFGILFAGAVPVPLYPPARMSQIEEHVRRHAGILANARAVILITTVEMRRLAAVLRVHASTLRTLTTADELRSMRAAPTRVVLTADSTALLQYTSGSTGQPKGVVLSHANILSNISALGDALAVRSGDVFVSWLPLYHDMGLIGAWLGTLYFGLPLIAMPPLSFLTRPVRWLQAIDRYGGTLSAAPNFAYELCLKRVTDAELHDLNLRTWRIAMNGAEAVMPDTLVRFQDRFARCGLPSTALTPVYGLAECSVGLTIPPLDRGPLIDVIERDSFTHDGIAQSSPRAADALRFVSCGQPIEGHEIRIIDDAGKPASERHAGRLEFRGPSTTRGYFRNTEATTKLIHDGWLDSGDRGYIANGEVYVTGRIKDIIIRAGRHVYPDELEAAIGAIEGIRKGCVAVFGSTDVSTGTERVIVLAETRTQPSRDREALRQAIIDTVARLLGEPPDDVALAAPHTVLKTSSGKIRRSATKAVYESGRLAARPERTARMQLLRLFLSAVRPASQRALRRAADVLYGTYFWAVFAVIASGTALFAFLPFRPHLVWSFSHHASRMLLRLTGISFTIVGHDDLEQGAARIIVVNHSSYLDGLFLLAAFPRASCFVAKRELTHVPIVGKFLRQIGTVFVERFDVRAGVKDARALSDLAARGASCIFFPEGTFTRAPGLMAFHLGAFAAAVHANLPVIPVALCGTRALLHDEQWLPRRAPVVMHIGRPITAAPARNEFAAAAALRDAARDSILKQCGEPDLLGSAMQEQNPAVSGEQFV